MVTSDQHQGQREEIMYGRTTEMWKVDHTLPDKHLKARWRRNEWTDTLKDFRELLQQRSYKNIKYSSSSLFFLPVFIIINYLPSFSLLTSYVMYDMIYLISKGASSQKQVCQSLVCLSTSLCYMVKLARKGLSKLGKPVELMLLRMR